MKKPLPKKGKGKPNKSQLFRYDKMGNVQVKSMKSRKRKYTKKRKKKSFGWVDSRDLKDKHVAEAQGRGFRRDFTKMLRPSTKNPTAIRKRLGIVVEGGDAPAPVQTFDDVLLPVPTRVALASMGIIKPSPIQAQLIPAILSGHDCLGLARTGSGKTMAFMLPMMIHVMAPKFELSRNPIGLVLAPTRELAHQILDHSRPVCRSMGVAIGGCIGGTTKQQIENAFARGMQVCVATPCSFFDIAILDGCTTSCARLTYVVLDEVDRMLEIGFEEQIRATLQHIRDDRQMVVTSATCPSAVQQLLKDFMPHYVKVSVEDPNAAEGGDGEDANADNLDGLIVNPLIQQHIHFPSAPADRLSHLISILTDSKRPETTTALIFGASREGVIKLQNALDSRKIDCVALHGKMKRLERSKMLNEFRNGGTRVLVATDIAARGIDLCDLSIVINYDLPRRIRDYVHRIGRTGRAGKSGEAHSYFLPDDLHLAPSLISVLKNGNQTIPEKLKEFARKLPGPKREIKKPDKPKGPPKKVQPADDKSKGSKVKKPEDIQKKTKAATAFARLQFTENQKLERWKLKQKLKARDMERQGLQYDIHEVEDIVPNERKNGGWRIAPKRTKVVKRRWDALEAAEFRRFKTRR